MPIQIDEPSAEPSAATDAVDLLMACHARIRRFSALAQRIAQRVVQGAAPDPTSVTAVRRYFTEALPLHAADEETLFLPKLGALVPVRAELSAQHEHIERLLPILSDRWSKVLDGARPDDLTELTTELTELLIAHITLEESTLIPTARAELSAEDHQHFVAAMHARRQ